MGLRLIAVSWYAWAARRQLVIGGCARFADLVPRRLPKRVAVTVRGRNGLQWLVFQCPCPLGHQLFLNLSGQRRPAWQLSGPWHMPSVAPSVHVLPPSGPGCHFFIRSGQVEWAQ